jgi:hypothetical protein
VSKSSMAADEQRFSLTDNYFFAGGKMTVSMM